MNLRRSRRGLSLAAVIGVVSLVAVLAAATLSVTTRVAQGSTIAARGSRLDAAATATLTAALSEWAGRSLGELPVGASSTFAPIIADPLAHSVTVVHLTTELFWIVVDVSDVDDAHRRENLVVRVAMPRVDSLAPLTIAGDALLSSELSVVRDTANGCAPAAADLVVPVAASVQSSGGALPPLSVARDDALAGAVDQIGRWPIDSIASRPDLVLAGGAAVAAPSGIVVAAGDLTITGGSGSGILWVKGRLTIMAPARFGGLIVADGGLTAQGPGVELTGLTRVGGLPGASTPALEAKSDLTIHADACAVQVVLRKQLRPRLVAGRAWAEMY